MKLRALGIGTLALGLLTGGYSFSSLASSNDEKETESKLIKADMRKLEPGEKGKVSEDVEIMVKTVLDEDGKVTTSERTFKPGEMPDIPEDADMMTKTMVNDGKMEE
ncbi:hypothetical protein ACIQ6U_22020 [Lysinibacillus fusiformis]|uniref:hypothetical protein n=1 Tax=Lysinibacillus fusiformis TaxID=28031 RepID=UPI00381C85D4